MDDSFNHPLDGCPVLEIPVAPNQSGTPFLDYRAQKQILGEFQPKLLMYRLMNLARVRDLHFDRGELDGSWADVTACLASSAVGDPELQKSITELVKKQEGDFSKDSATFLRKTVLEVLLHLCHTSTQSTLTVGEMTRATNKALEEKGETLLLEARAAGDILRSLRVRTERLGSQGRGIVLLNDVRKHLHTIARNNGIDLRGTGLRSCPICIEMQDPLGHTVPEEFGIT